tara:strand:+ start:1164 stop:1457 length:294 start_codon:yes stop_codon:yes gene_type:complete
MTIASRKAIQIAGPDKKKEEVVTFKKEEDGTYTKITSYAERDYKTGTAKSLKSDTKEDGPYSLVEEGQSFDEKMTYYDFDGTEKYIFLKKVETKGEK